MTAAARRGRAGLAALLVLLTAGCTGAPPLQIGPPAQEPSAELLAFLGFLHGDWVCHRMLGYTLDRPLEVSLRCIRLQRGRAVQCDLTTETVDTTPDAERTRFVLVAGPGSDVVTWRGTDGEWKGRYSRRAVEFLRNGRTERWELLADGGLLMTRESTGGSRSLLFRHRATR